MWFAQRSMMYPAEKTKFTKKDCMYNLFVSTSIPITPDVDVTLLNLKKKIDFILKRKSVQNNLRFNFLKSHGELKSINHNHVG